MAILQQCPICRAKQKTSNKICKCGHDLDKAKRSRKVKFYIKWSYRDNGKQKQKIELIGTSIEEARASEGKRKAQKKERPRVLDLIADKTTFSELAEWYINLETVKDLRTYERICICINNFNKVFGYNKLNDLKLTQLENYRIKRTSDGMSPATIHLELIIAQRMVGKAFDDDKISGESLRPFRKLKSEFIRGSNARERTISFSEYITLQEAAPEYLKNYLIIAMNTGMRVEEILHLQWSMIDRKEGFIRLAAEDTKEKKKKIIPINNNVAEILDSIVIHVHHPFVLAHNHKPIHQFTYHFQALCKKAGIPYGNKTENGIVPRDIRRTVKSNMVDAEVDEVYRDMLLGHSKQGMDKYYLQVKEKTLKEAMQKYTTWLDNQLQVCDQMSDHKK